MKHINEFFSKKKKINKILIFNKKKRDIKKKLGKIIFCIDIFIDIHDIDHDSWLRFKLGLMSFKF